MQQPQIMPFPVGTGKYLAQSRLPLWQKREGAVAAKRTSVPLAERYYAISRESRSMLQTNSVMDWNDVIQFPYTAPILPSLYVTLDARVKYTFQDINFKAYVSGLPGTSTFNFTCNVTTPSGRVIYVGSRFFCRSNHNGYAVVAGHFRTFAEIGIHELNAQLFSTSFDDAGWDQFGDPVCNVKFTVSKNFQMDRNSSGVNVFRAIYSDQPTSSNVGAWGISCDKATNQIYYSDASGNMLRRIDPETKQSFILSGNGTAASQVDNPRGLCVDEANRRLIIADAGNKRICFKDLDGMHLGSFGGPNKSSFSFPHDVAVTIDGTKIAVVDQTKKCIFLFDKFGTAGGKVQGHRASLIMMKPRSVAFGVDEKKLYVSDADIGNVLEVSANLDSVCRFFADQSLCTPQGLDIDASGTMIVCDVGWNCLSYSPPHASRNNFRLFKVGSTQFGRIVNVTTMSTGQLVVLNRTGFMYIF